MVEIRLHRINLSNKGKNIYVCVHAAMGFHHRFQKYPLMPCKEPVTAHFLSVYASSSQDEHLPSLESITFIILFSFLTEHIKSTKSSQESGMCVCGFSQSCCYRLSDTVFYYLQAMIGFVQRIICERIMTHWWLQARHGHERAYPTLYHLQISIFKCLIGILV